MPRRLFALVWWIDAAKVQKPSDDRRERSNGYVGNIIKGLWT